MDNNKRYPEIFISPKKNWSLGEVRELITYRELLYFLTWRSIKVKYKQTLFGIAWVILRPLITTAVLTFLFGKIAGFPSDGVPYHVFCLPGILLWTYFSVSIVAITKSFINDRDIITKIYFPRILIPLSANFSSMLDLLVSLSILFIMIFFCGIIPSIKILLVPLVLLITSVASFGIGIFLASLNVKYRDIDIITPFMLQICMFLTPIIYPVSFIPEQYRLFLYINPMAGFIELFRVCLFSHLQINILGLLVSFSSAIFMFVVGLVFLKRVGKTMVDII